jgi:hypothetical protein
MTVLFLLTALTVLTLAYRISLRLHPYTDCPRCKGARTHQGSLFGYACRACRACDGTGRKLRLGARLSKGRR